MMGVYKILNTINGKMYIGSSKNVEERLKQHKSKLKNGKHHSYKLQMDWIEFGSKAFKAMLIEKVDDELLSDRERFHIELNNCIQKGYNVSKNTGKSLIKLSELKEQYEEYQIGKKLNLTPEIPKHWKLDDKRVKIEIDLYKVLPIVHKYFEFYYLSKIKCKVVNVTAYTEVISMFKRSDIVFWLEYNLENRDNYKGGLRIKLSDIMNTIKDTKGDIEKAVKLCVDLPRHKYSWED